MDLELRGKAAIVTGASRGIGLAIACGLAAEGCDVALVARPSAALDDAAAQVRRLGVAAVAIGADLSQAAGAEQALDGAVAAFGRVDVLVNNASALAEHDVDAAYEVSFALDLMHAVRLSRLVVPVMESAGAGAIIHISSVSALRPDVDPAYAAMKAALMSHARSLAERVAGRGIRVNVVAPGSILVPGGYWDRCRDEQPEVYERLLAGVPRGRLGAAEEVANAVTFLASPRAALITGAILRADGGQWKGVF